MPLAGSSQPTSSGAPRLLSNVECAHEWVHVAGELRAGRVGGVTEDDVKAALEQVGVLGMTVSVESAPVSGRLAGVPYPDGVLAQAQDRPGVGDGWS
jgi:hypothetical protein